MLWATMLSVAPAWLWLSWSSLGLASPTGHQWKTDMSRAGTSNELISYLQPGNAKEYDCVRLASMLKHSDTPDLWKAILNGALGHVDSPLKRGASVADVCGRAVALLKTQQTQICQRINETEVEYTTAPGYKPNHDEISFDFFDKWDNKRLRPAFAQQRVADGAASGIHVRLPIEMIFSFAKRIVYLQDVDYIAIRSHAVFVDGHPALATPWELIGLKIHARCEDSGKRIVVDKWQDFKKVLLHPNENRGSDGSMARLWGGPIYPSDWHEDEKTWETEAADDTAYLTY